MKLWHFIVRLFGGAPNIGGRACPRCQFEFRWDGRRCGHCGYPGPLMRSREEPVPGREDIRQERGGTGVRTGGSVTSPSPAASRPAPKQKTLAHLDAGTFAPIARDDAMAQADAAGSLWGNPWFGRRDRIPPATDTRTLIIDRAMVGHGLITAEELVEIHKVGDEMERVRPDMLTAVHAASRAVELDKEAREERKRQKKAEAEERKRKHREAVEHRRTTDIIFLGRGVSRGLADRRANVEKLEAAGLPVLASPNDVAQAMGINIPRLRWLAFHSEAATVSHYIRFTVPKKSGGTRELSAPHQMLASAQQWILTNVLSKVPTHDAAHGFVPGRSTVTNANNHVGKSFVVNADLTDFFPTVHFHRVKGVFQELGYSPAVATIFSLLCTEAPRKRVTFNGKPFEVATGPRALPQGACTSPALSNLVARRLDARLTAMFQKFGWTYTRYADDLTFSADAPDEKFHVGYLLARLRHITQDEGFKVNEKKTRILRPSARQTVTGIVVNKTPHVPRKTVRRLRAILHRAKSEGLAAQNRRKHPRFESWLRGMVAYVHMVNPKQGKPLAEALASLR